MRPAKRITWFGARALAALAFVLALSGCAATTAAMPAADPPRQTPTTAQGFDPTPEPPTQTAAPVETAAVWLSSNVPVAARAAFAQAAAFPQADAPAQASLQLVVGAADAPAADGLAQSAWVYALVVPFPTPVTDVSLRELRATWTEGTPGKEVWLSAETLAAFSAWWGPPAAAAVRVTDAADLLEQAWEAQAAWALAPFEALEPGWRVLRVDNQSPLDPRFNVARYPLAVRIELRGAAPPEGWPELPTNYVRERMTVLAMSGVTALARRTAALMNEQGVLYPASSLGGWLREADLTHISNEVSFNPDCSPEKAALREALFCSNPAYIRLLDAAGADIIELTGNHNFDRGEAAYNYSLDLYQERGWGVYGGGANLEAARQPLLVEDHGNQLAFLGCNMAGPDIAWAAADRPGAAPCDIDALAQQVQDLRAAGYLPVVSLQAFETEDYSPAPMQRPNDFVRLAEAGAVVVSGSQAHVPQGFKLAGDGLIHYGLGNLFFDQTDSRLTRQAFVDRHVFYEGRYLGVELFPIDIEEYGRPAPMPEAERLAFLETIFDATIW